MSISRLLASIRTSSGRRGMSGQLNLAPPSLFPIGHGCIAFLAGGSKRHKEKGRAPTGRWGFSTPNMASV